MNLPENNPDTPNSNWRDSYTDDDEYETSRAEDSTLLERVGRHLSQHGIVAVLIAAVYLVSVRGRIDHGIVLFFGLPLIWAWICTKPGTRRATRIVAWSFLTALGLGSIIAHIPDLFPKLQAFDAQVDAVENRTLTWYSGVYILWLVLVLPIRYFVGNLVSHHRSEPAELSRFTCYLGLMTMCLAWVGIPSVFVLLGFWPIM